VGQFSVEQNANFLKPDERSDDELSDNALGEFPVSRRYTAAISDWK
jgi:hypothetical protein